MEVALALVENNLPLAKEKKREKRLILFFLRELFLKW